MAVNRHHLSAMVVTFEMDLLVVSVLFADDHNALLHSANMLVHTNFVPVSPLDKSFARSENIVQQHVRRLCDLIKVVPNAHDLQHCTKQCCSWRLCRTLIVKPFIVRKWNWRCNGSSIPPAKIAFASTPKHIENVAMHKSLAHHLLNQFSRICHRLQSSIKAWLMQNFIETNNSNEQSMPSAFSICHSFKWYNLIYVAMASPLFAQKILPECGV